MHQRIVLVGATTFQELTGISGPTRRILEAQGILRPLRSDKGWRLFLREDVQRALQWKKQRRKTQLAKKAARRG